MRDRSRSLTQVSRAAAVLLLSAFFVSARNHTSSWNQQKPRTSPTAVTLASAFEDAQRQVTIQSPNDQESQTIRIEFDDRHPHVAPSDIPATETIPSPRCASREEWQGACRIWSGKPHNRYLEFNSMPSHEGIGASLTRVAWALGRAISSDLELVMNGPLFASHRTGDFGDWMGLTHNSYISIRDPVGFGLADTQTVPFPEGNDDAWFRAQENRTSVIYVPDTMKVAKMIGWGIPVSPPNSDARVCRYVRQSMRNIFWSVPQYRTRCRGLLPDDHHTPQENELLATTGGGPDARRSWLVAVHVRRGDTIDFQNGIRSVTHRYFKATVHSVLQGIASTDPAAHVSILVFSEGPNTLGKLQLNDENGDAVTWDIANESCLDMDLACSQKVYLQTTAFETFDCMAAADVVVGSRSTFSDSAAAVSTNVKVMHRKNQTEQDRVVLDPEALRQNGAVSDADQAKMDTAIANYRYCSEEASRSRGSDATSIAARRFYQTVREV